MRADKCCTRIAQPDTLQFSQKKKRHMVLLLQVQQQTSKKTRGASQNYPKPAHGRCAQTFFFLASPTDCIVEFAGAGATILSAEIVVLAYVAVEGMRGLEVVDW